MSNTATSIDQTAAPVVQGVVMSEGQSVGNPIVRHNLMNEKITLHIVAASVAAFLREPTSMGNNSFVSSAGGEVCFRLTSSQRTRQNGASSS